MTRIEGLETTPKADANKGLSYIVRPCQPSSGSFMWWVNAARRARGVRQSPDPKRATHKAELY